MTQIDKDGRAGGRVDSAIRVAIRSAGGVNEGAETLKAEGGLRSAPLWLKVLPVTLPNEKTINNFKSTLTEFGAQTLLGWMGGGVGGQRAVIVRAGPPPW